MRKKWQRGYKGCRPADGQLMSFFHFPLFFSLFFSLLWFVCVESETEVSVWMTAITRLLQQIKNESVALVWNMSYLLELSSFGEDWRALNTGYLHWASLGVILHPKRSSTSWQTSICLFVAWWSLTILHLFFRNPPYYCHKNVFHQIYQFHLEGVVLARAFVSKSELFEDKHGITQSAPTPALRFLPLPIPHFKAERAQMKVWKEMENKLFICIWEETRHLSAFSLWRGVSAGAAKFNALQIPTDKQTRKWADDDQRAYRTRPDLLKRSKSLYKSTPLLIIETMTGFSY